MAPPVGVGNGVGCPVGGDGGTTKGGIGAIGVGAGGGLGASVILVGTAETVGMRVKVGADDSRG